jgi:hypothetical protein
MKFGNALIWLSPIVCLPRRCGDLDDISAVIEDISQDHPDRMRIVIALNAGRCPDCDAHGFDYKPRVGNVFSKACDGLQRHAGAAESVFCAANWPPTARVSHG